MNIKKIKRVMSVSIIKTLLLNGKYFGIKGILHPYIVASKNLKITNLNGKVSVDKNLPIGAITIGFPDISIFDSKYEKGIWNNQGEIVFRGKTHFGQGTRITNTGKMIFGTNFGISANTSIICEKEIIFGDNVLISWDVLIMDSDMHQIMQNEKCINPPKQISIGDTCWIGCRSTILKGTRLPANTIVASGSVISCSYDEENTIVTSNKVLKRDVTWR